MSDERTPLTANAAPQIGPTYVFPNGVSPRLHRQKRLLALQWFIALTFFVIVVAALVAAVVLSSIDDDDPQTVTLLAAENSTLPTAAAHAEAARKTLEATKEPIPDEPETEWALKNELEDKGKEHTAINAGIKALGDRELFEEGLQPMAVNSPAFRHYRSLNTNPLARKLARRGYVENHATQRIAELLNYTKSNGRSDIGRGPVIIIPDSTLDFTCDFNARYRRANGVCNNKRYPRLYGAAMIPYRRMVAPDYADGISLPRQSHNDSTPLPSARDVSLKIHRASYETDSNFTVMLAVFGQFLDHDITATSLTTSQEGESIDCCIVPPNTHPECFPVNISPDDPYYQDYNVTCMNFVRSAPAATGFFGPRQQLNQATAFIDGSVVYGTTESKQLYLRTMVNGTLRMYITEDGRELLPISANLQDGCNRQQMVIQSKYCFESGDDRANENLLLTSMHLIWARHHNYLARGLQKENPNWDDETTYQEARKILGAQMAHIAYNEFLPILFGRDLAAKKGLLPNTEGKGMSDTYDPKTNPAIANSFAGAAFRFAHTLLPGLFNISRDNSTPASMELHKMLFNPFSLWKQQGVDSAMLAATNTPVQRVDRFFSPEITTKLFEGTAEDKLSLYGLDLVSLNIQRGRDHGLPSYPVFRRHCNLPPVDTWEEMSTAIEPSSLDSIRQIYSTPYDVDVYTGALSEPPLEGALFGPLLTCLVSDQFLRIKKGDSHWYERKVGPQRFTQAQLHEIYKTTLAQIICRNSDSMQIVRQYVMERLQNDTNEYVDCELIDNFNFTAWSNANKPFKLHTAKVSQPMTLIRVMTEKPLNGVIAKPVIIDNSTFPNLIRTVTTNQSATLLPVMNNKPTNKTASTAKIKLNDVK